MLFSKGNVTEKTVVVTLLGTGEHYRATHLERITLILPPTAPFSAFRGTTMGSLLFPPMHGNKSTSLFPSPPSARGQDPDMRTELLGGGARAPRRLVVRMSGAAARAEVELRRGGGAGAL